MERLMVMTKTSPGFLARQKVNPSMKRKIVSLLLAGSLIASPVALTGCSEGMPGGAKIVKLDPANPTAITVWHYYSGAQQEVFDELVKEFNETTGAEQGIYVSSTSYGAVGGLEEALVASAEGAVGADEMPNIFSAYSDTAMSVKEKTELVSIASYFTGDELSEYVDPYIQSGYIDGDSNLYVFPVAKSTETFMMVKEDWEKFSKDTGATLDELDTIEGVTKVAQQYYEWTDAKTPKVKGDGKAFYGRDSIANYLLLTMNQLGCDLLKVKDGVAILNTDKDAYRDLWDNYYVPFVKGYFQSLGRFSSDDVKTGDIIAYTGSTVSSMYFPSQIENDNGKTKKVSAIVRNAPVAADGNNSLIQQGAGMSIVKSDDTEDYAASIFLKWFTQTDNNLEFTLKSSYLPVRKDANSMEAIDTAIEREDIDVDEHSYAMIENFMDSFNKSTFYSYPAFKNSSAVRKVLDYDFSDMATADAKAIEKKVKDKGVSREKAAAPYVSDKAFEAWYEQFTQKLQDALNQ